MSAHPERLPMVTVGIPTFNRVSSLRRTVASVLAQDYPNLEIVVSDNASTDGTQDFCENLVATQPRVLYRRQNLNIGLEANFRAAFALAHGELFAWLADDDWLDPAYVSRCVRELTECPDDSLVCGRAIYHGQGIDDVVEESVNLLEGSRHRRVRAFYRTVVRNGTLLGVIRRELLEVDAFPLPFGGDWLLVARLAFSGKVRTLEDVTLHRSLGGASTDMLALAIRSGVTPRLARTPNLVICCHAVKDIVSAHPPYDDDAPLRRLGLAAGVFAVFARRFYLPYWQAKFSALARGGVRRLVGRPAP